LLNIATKFNRLLNKVPLGYVCSRLSLGIINDKNEKATD
jgi:hypothetical protein